MPLEVSTRTIGDVALVNCNGRIVAGDTSALESEVRKCFADLLSVVLDLKDVTFIDSSGLGLLVRLVASTHATELRMNLCSAPPDVQKLFMMTNLTSVLQNHASPDDAMRALHTSASQTATDLSAPLILCTHESIDVLAWLRESLSRHGYQVQTASAPTDAMILIKARRPKLVIASPTLRTRVSQTASDRNISILELAPDFAHHESADALDSLLKRIRESMK